MRRAIVATILLTVPAMAAPRWLRRTTLIAACAASAADAVTTWQAKQAGLREVNPLFRASDGTPAMGRMVAFKAGLCAVSAWRQERDKRYSNAFTWGNIATAGGFGAIAWRNVAVRRESFSSGR